MSVVGQLCAICEDRTRGHRNGVVQLAVLDASWAVNSHCSRHFFVVTAVHCLVAFIINGVFRKFDKSLLIHTTFYPIHVTMVCAIPGPTWCYGGETLG
jgi:hypothetical protein